MITVRYFAWVREQVGTGSEAVELPQGVRDVAALTAHLRTRGETWQTALGGNHSVRVAVNQSVAAAHSPVADGDEVAYFPPVTGG
ncbi:MAG: molybdopterin converting factor subunit 1 [Chromatiales bacterium 21-64-14]|nr:MAG: molybdopterin converting factor subunit 1 [Chromatiales bacterium 21-64-14]HQU16124.1 molybdopterin converting factor subunit 1 [Gammaproteobacteria bacterium]HQU16126.1 molybdopterin converting factor subunit 1 [Gammaproteobacteria bacterium]